MQSYFPVVNCFHFSVSLGYKTTQSLKSNKLYKLWIAFIFQYLWDTKQLIKGWNDLGLGCELLSFFSIFGIQNNEFHYEPLLSSVVNCFHFSVSLGYKTTNRVYFFWNELLWIAFIFQYLWDTKQLGLRSIGWLICCELLSFFSIFGIQNNKLWRNPNQWYVVNCFHFSVSLGYKTTQLKAKPTFTWLWIAFIFQYLWDTKQLALLWNQ